MRRFLWYQGPLVGWAITIFILSSLPKLSKISLLPHTDKVAHAIFYGVLAWAAHRAFYNQDRWAAVRSWSRLLAILFALLYGLTDEVHQSFVPGREPSLLDLAADAVGATIAVALIAWRQRRRELRAAGD